MKWSLDPVLYTSAGSEVDTLYQHRMREQSETPVPTDRMKPRVTLVVGPSPFSMMRGWEFFICSPFEGISYVATVLHNAGYPVRIVDVRFSRAPVADAYRQIMEGTDWLGIATFEDNYPFVEELIDSVKVSCPTMPVVLGGSLVTSVPHIFMKETKADVAVISEGELTIQELLDAYTEGVWEKRLPHISGIWYRAADGKVHRNPPRGQMKDLDALPNMNLGLWPQSKGPLGLQPQIIASHSRGCKMDCSFCYRTTPQLREKSPEKLRQELRWLKDQYNINFVFFTDLTFSSNKKRTLEICDVISEFDLRWTCLTRCADVDPEVLAAMTASGCDIVLYGVESLAPDILKQARKGSSEHLATRAMHLTQEAGSRFGGLMIVGLPGETEESLEQACLWAEQHGSITRVKYLSAMPGTTVYFDGLKNGIIRSEVEHLRWLSVEQALVHDEYLNYNGLPEEVSRRAYKRLYDAYCPGPVMDFHHFPETLQYFCPDGRQGYQWRGAFSSVSGPTVPGVERFRNSMLKPSPRVLQLV